MWKRAPRFLSGDFKVFQLYFHARSRGADNTKQGGRLTTLHYFRACDYQAKCREINGCSSEFYPARLSGFFFSSLYFNHCNEAIFGGHELHGFFLYIRVVIMTFYLHQVINFYIYLFGGSEESENKQQQYEKKKFTA